MADWIFILFRWLMALPDRAGRVLETGLPVVADAAVVYWIAARWVWRRGVLGSPARNLPRLRRIGWMTYCLGQGWTTAPLEVFPALILRAPTRGVRRLGLCGAAGSIRDNRFLSCSERVRGFTAPLFGAPGHSTDFSMPAFAADF